MGNTLLQKGSNVACDEGEEGEPPSKLKVLDHYQRAEACCIFFSSAQKQAKAVDFFYSVLIVTDALIE